MMKEDFDPRKKEDKNFTSNKFTVKIKIGKTGDFQNFSDKPYTSSSTETDNATSILQTLWKIETTESSLIKEIRDLQENSDESSNENFNTIRDFQKKLTEHRNKNLTKYSNKNFNALQNYSNLKNYIIDHPNLRTTDSEFQFFADFFSQNMTLELNKNDKITRIEIHGFTTRDMCPCCFTHMGLFYDRLKEALNNFSNVQKNSLFYNFIQQIKDQTHSSIQLAFYISSSIQLGLQEFEGSIYPSYKYTSGTSQELTYKNSVDNITKFYPEKEEDIQEIPKEGIFCTFIRDTDPSWSLQYYTKDDSEEQIEVESRQFSLSRSQYNINDSDKKQIKVFSSSQNQCDNKEQEACTITCYTCSEHELSTISKNPDNIIIKCTEGNSKNDIRKQKVKLSTQPSLQNITTFRNLITPWITKKIFNFAKEKADSLTIEESIDSTDSDFKTFLNSSN